MSDSAISFVLYGFFLGCIVGIGLMLAMLAGPTWSDLESLDRRVRRRRR